MAVNFVDMEDAANTIKGLGGEYVVQPQVCQRAACTNGAGVWVCNDVSPILDISLYFEEFCRLLLTVVSDSSACLGD